MKCNFAILDVKLSRNNLYLCGRKIGTMDYTKIPRDFIYKDRKDLDDFPVRMQCGFMSMEGKYLDALEQRPFIKESYEAPELILGVFNNARYITTLICLENHPNHYLRKYLRIAGSDNRNIAIANHAMPATMALVKNYLCHYMPQRYRHSIIVEEITNNFNTDDWKEATLGGQDDFYKLVIEDSSNRPGWTVDTRFEPRDIREVIDIPLTTARDLSENIDFILESLEKVVGISDEEIAPLNAMYKKLESWFPTELDDNLHKELALDKIEKRLKKLDPNNAYEFFNLMNEMEKSQHNGTPIPQKTKEDINKYLKKTMGVDMDEIASVLSGNHFDLEQEIDNLKTKVKEDVYKRDEKPPYNSTRSLNKEEDGIVENLQQQLADAQNRIAELEKIIGERDNTIEELNNRVTEFEQAEEDGESISAHNKVRMELIMKFMEKDGLTLERNGEKIHGHKTKAAKILETLTGLPLQTCKNYITNRDLNIETHREEILRINTLLQALRISSKL